MNQLEQENFFYELNRARFLKMQEVPFQLINHFLLFQYSYVTFLSGKEYFSNPFRLLERLLHN